MTIPAGANNISFQNTIEAEFGPNPARSLGSYRVSDTIHKLTNLPLDTGIPQSGAIRFSDFRGKSLNVVVNLWQTGGPYGNATQYHINAKTNKWNNNQVIVVGRFRNKKESGSKIIIHIDKNFRSQSNTVRRDNPNRCAVRTGGWTGIVGNLRIDVANNGRLTGAGGRGGNGGRGYQLEGGQPGGSGSSALGVEYPSTVNINGGLLRAGYGGGGGGGSGRERDKGKDRKGSGGGGGGGAGLPFGDGGSVTQSPGPGEENNYQPAIAGSESNATIAGAGGGGAINDGEAYGGAGGNGGQNGENADNGQNGGQQGVNRGLGGGNGSAIRATSGSISVTVNNSGTYIGGRSNGGIS